MSKYENLSKEQLLSLVEKQEKELKSKKYGLVWDAEREPEQVVLDCENNLPVLKRIKGKEIKTNDEDDNILIEGDNYHALSVLNYTHKGKIDVIYIDPPYNTGNKDFLYNDRYVDKEDGFRHSKWLNFMEKRLNLAKELLNENGVLIVSIDDNEIFNLKLLCDKIFGEKNFIANLPTIMNLKGNNDQFGFAGTHEYTVFYAKDISLAKINHFDVDEEVVLADWSKDEIGFFKKGANLKATGINAPREKRPNLFFPIFINSNQEAYVTVDDIALIESDIKLLPITDQNEMSWRWSKKKITNENHNIIVVGNSLYKKQRPDLGDLPSQKPKTIFYKPEYSSGNGTALIKSLFGTKIFNNPKPPELIKDLLFLSSKKNSVILDFMAGSGTTGHAVLELNKQDNGSRKFVLCTNNENNICEDVTYPRIKNVINGYNKNGNGAFVDGLGGNLQYFKTSFVKKTKNRDQLKINLTRKCTEMLCVKENIFNEQKVEEDYKIYSSNKDYKYLCVYFNFIDDSFEQFVKELKQIKEKKVIYMFALDNNIEKDLFKGVKKYRVEPIPQNILDVYRQLVKMNIPEKKELIVLELNSAKVKLFEEKQKDESARILRIVLEKVIQKISQSNGINIFTERGKEEKISKLNDVIKAKEIIAKVEWEENKTYLAIGNHAAHGEYDEYEIKHVQNFYKHVQSLLNKFDIV